MDTYDDMYIFTFLAIMQRYISRYSTVQY